MGCPRCHHVWAFDVKDERGINAINPVQRGGRWQVYTYCVDCRSMSMFTEVLDGEADMPSVRTRDPGASVQGSEELAHAPGVAVLDVHDEVPREGGKQ